MPICISGMHRSGTSMVAKVLLDAGLDLGPADDMMPAAADNPEGFWENLRIVGINDALLAQLGGGWDLPPAPPTDWNGPEFAGLREAAVTVVESFADADPWGWKDPRNCLTIPFWHSVASPLRHVFVVRNPLEVARSLHRRNSFSLPLGLSLWHQYASRFLADTDPANRIVTHFDAYFADAEREVRRLLAFADIPHDAATVTRAATAATPRLKHHHLTVADLIEAGVAPAIVNLYSDLCAEAGFAHLPGASLGLHLPKADRAPTFPAAVVEHGPGRLGLWMFGQQQRIRELEVANVIHDMARKELDGRIAERDGTVLEREARIADRDARIAERDGTVLEREARIADRDARIAEREARISDRDARIAERDRAITRLTREMSALGQTIKDQFSQIKGLTEQVETFGRHETELRAMLIASQEHLLFHDTEIMGTLGGALARVAPGAPVAIYYRQMLEKVRSTVRTHLPPTSTALVATLGDDEFLDLGVTRAVPFPHADSGVAADYTSVESDAAIGQLEALRASGAGYLVVPSPAQAWLARLPALGKHLDRHYPAIVHELGTCTIYPLGGTTPG